VSETGCAAEGCRLAAVHRCAYEDDSGVRCATAWCDEHIERVGSLGVCRRHRQTLEIIRSRQSGVYEVLARPAVADRSLSLTAHLAEVLGPSVERLLEGHLDAWPDAHLQSERYPRPFWDAHGKLTGWELGWSILSPRGLHLRVAVRARSGAARPSVQVVAEHLVAYDGEPAAESVRGRQTAAQKELVHQIEELLDRALRGLPATWRPV